MEVLNALNNVNVQIPVGYLLVFLATVIGGWIAIKKMVALATWTIAKVSIGFLGYIASCSLFVCGLAGMGYSGGAMSNAPLEKPSGMISYDRLERMTRDKDMTQEKLKLAIDYADTHTKPFSLSDGQPVEAFDWRFPCAMFWGSLGTMAVGLIWFICKLVVQAINS